MRATFSDAGNVVFDTGDHIPCGVPAPPPAPDPVSVQLSATCSNGVATYLLDFVNPGPATSADISLWIAPNASPTVSAVTVPGAFQHVEQLPYDTIARFGVDIDGQTIFMSPDVTSTSDADCGTPAPSPVQVVVTEREDCVGDRVRVSAVITGDTPPVTMSVGWSEYETEHAHDATIDTGRYPLDYIVDSGSTYGTFVRDRFGRYLFSSEHVAGTDCAPAIVEPSNATISFVCIGEQPTVRFAMTNTTASELAVGFRLTVGGGQSLTTDTLDSGEPTSYAVGVDPNVAFVATIDRFENDVLAGTIALYEATSATCSPDGGETATTTTVPTTTTPTEPTTTEPTTTASDATAPALPIVGDPLSPAPDLAVTGVERSADAMAPALPETGGSTTRTACLAALILTVGLALRRAVRRRPV